MKNIRKGTLEIGIKKPGNYIRLKNKKIKKQKNIRLVLNFTLDELNQKGIPVFKLISLA